MSIDDEAKEWILVLDVGQTDDNLYNDYIHYMNDSGHGRAEAEKAWDKYWKANQ